MMTAFSGARSEVRAAVGYMDEDIISDAKDTYYTRKDSFQQYLDDIESSMLTQAGKDAYNQILQIIVNYLICRSKFVCFTSLDFFTDFLICG